MKCELTKDIMTYMLEQNKDRKQHSFFFPDDYEETKELVEEGASTFIIKHANGTIAACAIADPVDDNKTVEVSGPFGDTKSRIELLEEMKQAYPEYKILLFLTEDNELSKKYHVVSDEYSMEIMAQKSKIEHVDPFEQTTDSLDLHDKMFPTSYANAQSLIENYDLLVYKEAGKVVGYIAYEKEENYLDFVAVDPCYRRKQIAQKLIYAALTDMADNVVKLTVSSENEEAIALYLKMGFSIKNHMMCLLV